MNAQRHVLRLLWLAIFTWTAGAQQAQLDSGSSLRETTMSNSVYLSELWRTNSTMAREMQRELEQQFATKERSMAADGYRKISYLQDFVCVFANAFQDFNFATKNGPHLWILKAGLHGRYVLKMSFRFKVDNNFTNVIGYESPQFELWEFAPEERRGFKGRPLTLINSNKVASFGTNEWQKLMVEKGDFWAIGITLKTNSPIESFDNVWKHIPEWNGRGG